MKMNQAIKAYHNKEDYDGLDETSRLIQTRRNRMENRAGGENGTGENVGEGSSICVEPGDSESVGRSLHGFELAE